jgi:hypothetical protein
MATIITDDKVIKIIYRTGLQGPKGEQGDPIYVGNIDGGMANSNYGGPPIIDGGTAEGWEL